MQSVEPRAPRVLVIGGGFSGVLTSAHLARRGVPVTLIERDHRVGPGLAYRAASNGFLLNVPAGRMSAWPHRPDDFVTWLRREQPEAGPGSFARRDDYGRYVEHVGQAAPGLIACLRADALDVERTGDRFTVSLADGRRLEGQALVLALGNAAPRSLVPAGVSAPAALIDNPFTITDQEGPGETDRVALAGTGLTALDVMAWLRGRGHRGRIVAFSRHGYAPLAHRGAAPATLPDPPAALKRRPTVRRLTAWLRQLAMSLRAFDVDPARAVDALRPITAELWQRLPVHEQRRFLRHGRALWDLHRHRAPASVLQPFTDGVREGRIHVHAARLQSVSATATGGLELRLRPRGATTTFDLQVHWLINCTGPERDLSRQANPLVRSLLARGLVQRDPLALGAVTTERGELVDANGANVPGAYVVGAWRMPRLFESTAVPELRDQAAAVASDVAARVASSAVADATMPATA
jgi:uncharacterized NAD(P)/FAD-binding protein YdhS